MNIHKKIYESKDKERIILREITETLINNVLNSFITDNSTRSSVRSDDLHESLKIIGDKLYSPAFRSSNKIEVFIDSNKSDTLIPSVGNKSGTYSLDLLIKKNGINKMGCEVAAPATSINKNYDNNQNKLIGRLMRVYSHKENCLNDFLYYQINFIPRVAPVIKAGLINNFEKVHMKERSEDENYTNEKFGDLDKLSRVINVYYSVNPTIYNNENIKNGLIKTKKDISNELQKLDFEDVVLDIDVSNLVSFYEKINEI